MVIGKGPTTRPTQFLHLFQFTLDEQIQAIAAFNGEMITAERHYGPHSAGQAVGNQRQQQEKRRKDSH